LAEVAVKGLRAASFFAGIATTFSSAMLFCVQFPVVSTLTLLAPQGQLRQGRTGRRGGTGNRRPLGRHGILKNFSHGNELP
jgi:hypothetical protein